MLWIGLIALGILVVTSVRRIPEGQVYTLHRLGGPLVGGSAGAEPAAATRDRAVHAARVTDGAGDLAQLHQRRRERRRTALLGRQQGLHVGKIASGRGRPGAPPHW